MAANRQAELPGIPAKRYFTIGEVARLCDLKPHVLRYWEQEFCGLQKIKRRGNRRYYQQADLLLIRQIRSLLYEQGYTIEGARNQLATEQVAAADEQTPYQQLIRQMLSDLDSLKRLL